ncbi:MAG: 3-deoxy-D-manno-octulosonic acid transferase [Pseudomonadales bacterium]|nr:3-deoxy-D-manno-octulosonic acid transferase [Pseudomonadales bacterium]MDG1442460.1 3-deoxy-D-manno-octulosonic acid transferase [Pseudomonadales bacterium]
MEHPIIRFLYSLLFYCLTPFVLFRVYWRSRREPGYADDLSHRFGAVPVRHDRPIWVHAVSAGETIAIVPLVKRLVTLGHAVIVTNMTPTGRERVESLLLTHCGGSVTNAYAPYDLPVAVSRFLARTQPKALIIVDTELWPNMLHQVSQQNIPSILVNGRLSEKSAIGYARIGMLSRPMFNQLTCVCAQSALQGERFKRLGVSSQGLHVTGSVKFDLQLPEDLAARRASLHEKFKGRSVLLAASTHKGEEDAVLLAFKEMGLSEDYILVLAPRHPARADAVFALCEQAQLPVQRHSVCQDILPETKVYLIDTLGELLYFYSIVNSAFVGGSLVDVGGHNPMEPAHFGMPMLMGGYLRNIKDIAEQFVEGGAMKITQPSELAADWREIELNPRLHQQMSEAAEQVMQANRGALDRVEQLILPHLQ